MLKETRIDEYPFYAKISCQHGDTYTSTRLQLIVYKDEQCSWEYSANDETKGSGGYDIHGDYLITKVSFHPPFYRGQDCNPEALSDTYTKQYTSWYDND
jgi:hypothetical protein